MDRAEAINYLKEILRTSNCMSPELISFEDRVLVDESRDFRIHIKCPMDEEDKKLVHHIAQMHDLQVLEEKGELVIYRPKVEKNDISVLP